MRQAKLEPDDPRILERVLRSIDAMSHEEIFKYFGVRPEDFDEIPAAVEPAPVVITAVKDREPARRRPRTSRTPARRVAAG